MSFIHYIFQRTKPINYPNLTTVISRLQKKAAPSNQKITLKLRLDNGAGTANDKPDTVPRIPHCKFYLQVHLRSPSAC